ncbi:hypothetical protein BGZ72_006319 [Mortierella alpina]|nr:hypothetical protein BGZ72_006319 [Mortierella alpina]
MHTASIAAILVSLAVAITTTASPVLEKRIIGGGPVSKGEMPFIAQLVNKRSPCTGFLVGPQTIITAAHCLGDRTHTGIVVGGTKFKVGKSVTALEYVPHPEYNSTRDTNDIGLIFIKEKVKGPYAKIRGGSYPKAMSKITAAGFGYIDNKGTEPKGLNKVNLNVARSKACKDSFPDFDKKTQFCTLPNPLGHSVCGGDSGGPMFQKSKVIGIVSHGLPGKMCGQDGGYQYYTFIRPFLPWVNLEIERFKKNQTAVPA